MGASFLNAIVNLINHFSAFPFEKAKLSFQFTSIPSTLLFKANAARFFAVVIGS